ncbi:Trimethyllysine dioxygenase [Penicillium verhagenii]|uniref:Trimethyllysine dioxygenase n=1 Tax=Penicillium verhagenii TaxID=1562060 RepID=UPI0025458E87|nr:Trimethyllysine dioxygenase [Penicillium verhagenii]KAJ5947131.1 Trimethyllysine dioxygenase [Penicillium verhagenii]
MSIRSAMSWSNRLTSLPRLRAPQRASWAAVPRGLVHVPLRWSSNEQARKSGAPKTKTANIVEIPDQARNSVILKQFDSETDIQKAYATYSKGYLTLKGEGSVPKDIDVTCIKPSPTDVKIGWSDGHESVYSWDWLVAHQTTKFTSRDLGPHKLSGVKYGLLLYNTGFIDSNPILRPLANIFNAENQNYPEASYQEVISNDRALLDWLQNIHGQGFCFIKGVPVDPEATKALIERIAFIRHTHYGGFWDFTADLTYKDTAYTNEPLGGHTDNTYFTDPARLQLFHLLSHTDGSGGESLLVDALAAAHELKKKSPLDYDTLATERHSWHASGNEDVCIQPSFRAPVLSIHPDFNKVYQVRWNNYDRAPKNDWSVRDQTRWYKAARNFNSILHKPSNQIWTQLKPGTALIFDNWRMLHGRSEFTGKRRMCGGYVNNDDFISRLRLLKHGREKVLNNLGSSYKAATLVPILMGIAHNMSENRTETKLELIRC